jgi:hypothetical protein
MSPPGGGFNRSTQHFIAKRKVDCTAMCQGYFRSFRRQRDLSLYS